MIHKEKLKWDSILSATDFDMNNKKNTVSGKSVFSDVHANNGVQIDLSQDDFQHPGTNIKKFTSCWIRESKLLLVDQQILKSNCQKDILNQFGQDRGID